MGYPEKKSRQESGEEFLNAGMAAKAAMGSMGRTEEVHRSPESRMHFVRKVYATLAGGIAVGSVGAYFAANQTVAAVVSGNFSAFALAELVFMIATLMLRKVPVLNLILFAGFNLSFGAMVGSFYPILESTGQVEVFWQAAGGTVAIFGGLTAYAFATRKDFSWMGGWLYSVCWGLFFVSLANWWFNVFDPGSMLYQSIGLVMVCGFILYDTSNVLLKYEDDEYVGAALELAWDFWYLMLKLIQIFMDRD